MLAGGAGRRLGGVDKPGLTVAPGRTLLSVALDAVASTPGRHRTIVVVGPPRTISGRPDQVLQTREQPPGSGPAAAIAAGMSALSASPGPDGRAATDGSDAAVVAILASDLPGVTRSLVHLLTGALRADPARRAVVARDSQGRDQLLLSVVRARSLRDRLAERSSWANESVRTLLGPLVDAGLPFGPTETMDIDTPADLALLQTWALGVPGSADRG